MSGRWPRPRARRRRVQAQGAADLLLDALVTRFTEGYAASVAPLSQALRAFGDPTAAERTGAGCGWRAASRRISGTTSSGTCSRPAACASRATPARSACSRSCANYLAALNVHSGAFATAAALIDEVDAITQATGLPPLKYAAFMLAAARGDQAQALFDDRRDGDGARRGLGARACTGG